MEPSAKSRGGRPWSFDRDKAIETAMRLFWRHGYEGVSIGDLTKAIGIAPPSLYAAFGSKAGLYQEALARYEASPGTQVRPPAAPAASLPEAVRLLLEGAVRAVTHPDRERGCMISSGMVECHPEHAGLARELAERRNAMQERLARALQPFADINGSRRLARHLAAIMQGISIQARDGTTPAELQEIVEEVVSGISARFSLGRQRH
ncbi:TetR/AcrR family transcriptional regulator [Phyllobacterium salinisoli]|uniref:TetR/AcrR family transcriptional regulator n=1 Tax=Phyllobacterium salinisoli TaxID=1899321 RepID=A0A368K4F4_9HYPH|nr:TetR/AcrR family transcriptional regulator [Phyllobacterium salinisoli]RCS22890.1 TetR/AcrR family transcriptional regulator [Phyllobacterium salinisoli]